MDSSSPPSIPDVPLKFKSIIVDFTNDLSVTFPEIKDALSTWSTNSSTETFDQLFQYSLTVYPERFFDILNQNEEIFAPESDKNVHFLPNLDFKTLYHCEGVSEKTQKTIWKYLQLILFTIVGSVKDKSDFGDTMNMFDGLQEGDLQDKLKDVMSGISSFFSEMDKNVNPDESSADKGFDFTNPPKPEELNDHLKNLFDGKIGSLAKELADEIGGDLANTFGEDMKDLKSTKDVFSKMMANPDKISGLVKTVGEKLQKKMADGEISKDEIMSEAGELMRKMKEMGGAGNFADMFKNIAKDMGVNVPKGAKIDKNALVQMEKKMTATEKMKARIEHKKQKQVLEKMEEQLKMQRLLEERRKSLAETFTMSESADPNHFVFRLNNEESQEKSSSKKPADDLDAIMEMIEGPKVAATLSKSQKKKQKDKQKKTEQTIEP
jgi:hypothetical protein